MSGTDRGRSFDQQEKTGAERTRLRSSSPAKQATDEDDLKLVRTNSEGLAIGECRDQVQHDAQQPHTAR